MISYIATKVYKYITRKENNKNPMIDGITKTQDESALVREQLKRNYEFFREEGMKRIQGSYVIVVGIGGVGR